MPWVIGFGADASWFAATPVALGDRTSAHVVGCGELVQKGGPLRLELRRWIDHGYLPLIALILSDRSKKTSS